LLVWRTKIQRDPALAALGFSAEGRKDRDVEELITAIGDYIDKHNCKPKPFIWTAKASDILEKVKRARAKLDNC
jgi:hypothetical protein